MSDVASLSVALHLNSAAFKSQITDAYQSAGKASKAFSDKATSQANALADAISRTGAAAQRMQGGLSNAEQGYNGIIRGAGQLNFVLHEVAAGSNVASSTIINALIPALHSLKNQMNGSSGGWKEQQQAARAAAAEMQEAATQQIALAQTEKASALAKAAIAEKTIAAAQAQREQAIAMDAYFAKQTQVNKLYGVSVSYQDEHLKNERAIIEANRAEAAALEKLKAAQAAALAADVAETEGKAALATATEAATVANTELSVAQRVAATSSAALNTALGLLGGPVGLGLSVIAAAGTAIYHEFKSAEEQTKTLNSAMLELGTSSSVSADHINRLSAEMGGTEESAKAVATAVKAGFSGDMLDQVAQLANAYQQAGGDAQTLVSNLKGLQGDPLAAMQKLTAAGVTLSESTIDQVLALRQKGEASRANDIIVQAAIDNEKSRLKELGVDVDQNTESVKTLGDTWGTAGEQAVIALGGAIDKSQEVSNRLSGMAKQLAADLNGATAAAQKDRLDNTAKVERYIQAGTSALQKRKAAMDALAHSNYAKDPEKYAAAVRGINAEYERATKKNRTSSTGENEGQRLLEQAQQRQAVLREQAATTDNLTESEKQLAAFDERISNLKGQHLSKSQQSVISMQDEIRAQLQVNAQLEREAQQRKLSAKYAKEVASWGAEAAAMQREGQNSVDALGMSQLEQETASARIAVINRFDQRRRKLEEDFTDKTSDEYKKRLGELEDAQNTELGIIESNRDKKLAAEGDYTAGFLRGTKDWVNTARDANSQMATYASSTFDNMASSLANFATTGKLSFRSFASSVISDLSKIAMKIAMSSVLQGVFGSLFTSASGSAGSTGTAAAAAAANVKLAKGGVSSGLSAYSNSIVSSPTMFAFAKGVGLMGEAGPEAVMPLTRSADGSLGVRASSSGSTVISVSAPVTITNGESGGVNVRNTANTSRQLKTIVETAITERLRREMAPGGVLYAR